MVCESCDTSNPISKTTQCNNCHIICLSCVEEEIRNTMATDRMYLSCPMKFCQDIIGIDSVTGLLPPLVLDLLVQNIRQKEEKASAQTISQMQGMISCPSCKYSGLMEDDSPYFECGNHNCTVKCCRYCKAPWTKREDHYGCYILSFVGTECLSDSSKLPSNWRAPLKLEIEMVYIWEPVQLNSVEGISITAFHQRTSARKIQTIYRIQNRRLWEKYILKRKHVEEEVGVANVKERYLWHGTKEENKDFICKEGFDLRIPTMNGAVWGKGIYFSTTATLSEKYYKGPTPFLFLSRVICGLSTKGNKNLTRPPYDNVTRRMYDSCCDNPACPAMFIIFDNSQCYPEYLIYLK